MSKPYAGKKLLCRMGSNFDDLQVVNVNDDSNPHFVDGPLFVGNVAMRIKNFNGITPNGKSPIPSTDYFGKRSRLFSIQLQGRFKEEINGDDILQGTIWNRRVKMPFGTSIILKIATMVDSTFSHELTGEKPWTMSTLLSSQNTLNIVKAESPIPAGPISISDRDRVLGAWKWGGATELEEDNALLRETIAKTELAGELPFGPAENESRRKWFQKKKHREIVTLSPDYVYSMDTFSPFLDLNTFNLKMGVSLNMMDYTHGQPHILVIKSKSKNQNFLVIEWRLVDVDAQSNPIIPEE